MNEGAYFGADGTVDWAQLDERIGGRYKRRVRGGKGGCGVEGGLLAEKLQRGVEQRRPGIADQLSHYIDNRRAQILLEEMIGVVGCILGLFSRQAVTMGEEMLAWPRRSLEIT